MDLEDLMALLLSVVATVFSLASLVYSLRADHRANHAVAVHRRAEDLYRDAYALWTHHVGDKMMLRWHGLDPKPGAGTPEYERWRVAFEGEPLRLPLTTAIDRDAAPLLRAHPEIERVLLNADSCSVYFKPRPSRR